MSSSSAETGFNSENLAPLRVPGPCLRPAIRYAAAMDLGCVIACACVAFPRSGDVTNSGLSEGAHALAVLNNDGVLPEPRIKADVDINVKPNVMKREDITA